MQHGIEKCAMLARPKGKENQQKELKKYARKLSKRGMEI